MHEWKIANQRPSATVTKSMAIARYATLRHVIEYALTYAQLTIPIIQTMTILNCTHLPQFFPLILIFRF